MGEERTCARCGETIIVPDGAEVTHRSGEIRDGRAVEYVVSIDGVDVHRCLADPPVAPE